MGILKYAHDTDSHAVESLDLSEERDRLEREQRSLSRKEHGSNNYERQRKRVAEWTDPNGGFFVWVELPDDIDAEAMLPTAAEEGVTYLPGELFFPDERGKNCLRLSFSQVSFEEMERGIEALARAIRTATRKS